VEPEQALHVQSFLPVWLAFPLLQAEQAQLAVPVCIIREGIIDKGASLPVDEQLLHVHDALWLIVFPFDRQVLHLQLFLWGAEKAPDEAVEYMDNIPTPRAHDAQEQLPTVAVECCGWEKDILALLT
jgi:hypothetical protein